MDTALVHLQLLRNLSVSCHKVLIVILAVQLSVWRKKMIDKVALNGQHIGRDSDGTGGGCGGRAQRKLALRMRSRLAKMWSCTVSERLSLASRLWLVLVRDRRCALFVGVLLDERVCRFSVVFSVLVASLPISAVPLLILAFFVPCSPSATSAPVSASSLRCLLRLGSAAVWRCVVSFRDDGV